jgi:hypothetical protein
MPEKIVLQSRERHAYLAVDGDWTPYEDKARRFNTAREAEELCRAKKFKNTDIVVLRRDQPPLRISVSHRA